MTMNEINSTRNSNHSHITREINNKVSTLAIMISINDDVKKDLDR
jgi:hypothetical protein